MRFGLLGLIFLLAAASASAQTMYVSDDLVITLRRGPGTQYAIIENLNSGERVQVLSQNPQTGYTQVRTLQGGTEGWVLTRYLSAQPIAAERLSVAESNLAAARERVGELEQRAAALSAELADTRTRLADAEAANTAMSSELADIRSASANAIALREQNESLRRRLNEREQELEQLTAQNADLTARTRQNWFVVGAAVLLAGIVLGLILPSLKRRRRSEW